MQEMFNRGVCKKSTKTVNNNTRTEYRYEGRLFASTTSLLASIYQDQGSLYEEVYDVSREDAGLAGWDPYAGFGRFELNNKGFKQFLKDQGVVKTSFKNVDIPIDDLLNDIMDVYKLEDLVEKL